MFLAVSRSHVFYSLLNSQYYNFIIFIAFWTLNNIKIFMISDYFSFVEITRRDMHEWLEKTLMQEKDVSEFRNILIFFQEQHFRGSLKGFHRCKHNMLVSCWLIIYFWKQYYLGLVQRCASRGRKTWIFLHPTSEHPLWNDWRHGQHFFRNWQDVYFRNIIYSKTY